MKYYCSRAFTLLEVLIGMSLLSVMMLLLLGSLRVCIQNWDAGEKKIAEVNRLAVLQQFFFRRLQNIRPLDDDFSFDEPVFSFQGDKSQLQFVGAMPASAGRMGLQLFKIGLVAGKMGKDIKVSVQPFFPLSDGEQWNADEITVLQAVDTLQFWYFGSEDVDAEPVWRQQWLDMEELPFLIAIAIKMQDGSVWPPIIVAPHNGAGHISKRINNVDPGMLRNGIFGQAHVQ